MYTVQLDGIEGNIDEIFARTRIPVSIDYSSSRAVITFEEGSNLFRSLETVSRIVEDKGPTKIILEAERADGRITGNMYWVSRKFLNYSPNEFRFTYLDLQIDNPGDYVNALIDNANTCLSAIHFLSNRHRWEISDIGLSNEDVKIYWERDKSGLLLPQIWQAGYDREILDPVYEAFQKLKCGHKLYMVFEKD